MYRKLKYPPIVIWEITPLCNHNCVHCFNYWRTDTDITKDLNGSKQEIPYKNFVDKIIELKPVQVVITGGEPLLVWDSVRDAILRFKGVGIHVTMNTNAALINDEIADFLSKNHISLLVSYPCSEESICNEIVNTKDAFTKINAGLQTLCKYRVRFSCNMVVSTKNLKYVRSTALYLRDTYGIKTMSITRVGKPINASEAFDGYMLSNSEIRQLIEVSTELYYKEGLMIDASAPYPACAFTSQEEFDVFSQKRLCAAGKSSYVIGSDGGVKACVRDEKIYGNLFVDDFEDIWEGMKEWRDGTLIPAECKKCDSFSFCMGGCRADQLVMMGDCSHMDSAANLSNSPVPFELKPAKVKRISEDDVFSLADDVSFLKENTGYRISRNGNFKHITDEAYDFLTGHRAFSASDLEEIGVREEDRIKVVSFLLQGNLIKPTN